MMNEIITALVGVGFNAAQTNETDISDVDTAHTFSDMFSGLVDDRVYPVRLPETVTLPAVNFQPVFRNHIEVDGEKVGRIDGYVLTIRAKNFPDLQRLSLRIASEVTGRSEQLEITDASTDFEADQHQFRADMEIEITTLATASQTLPASLVYSTSARAETSSLSTAIRQRVTEVFSVVLIGRADQLKAIRDKCKSALLGLELHERGEPVEYIGGNRLAQKGPLIYWREQYSYKRYISS
ncbi:hypothetical protein [Aliamphritea hakodatensis]|uniref:hypothetical protein n=1 Tax=Aliamphritea hakodatensis TaxID=2895352 RepID=UPI0022FD5486|nr:hypothetical protein [Aliamphritea hakodatensis]